MAAASANEGDFKLPCDGDRSTCLDTLLVNTGLEAIEVPGDGDCLFHAIAGYYKRSGEPIYGFDFRPENDYEVLHRTLREHVVEEFIKLVISKNPPYPDLLTTILIKNRTRKSLSTLAGANAWEHNSYDTMINAIPTILRINLNIYSVHVKASNQYYISKAVGKPKQPELLNGRGLPTINLFLLYSHYWLLYPRGRNVRSQAQMNIDTRILREYEEAVKAKEQEYEEASKKAAKKLQEKNARNASRKVKPSASRKSRNASNDNAELQAALKASRNMSIAAIKKQIANLESGVKYNVSVRRKPSAAVKPSAASRKNHNSLNNNFSRLSIGNQPRVNPRTAMEERFPISDTVVDVSKDPLKISLKKSLQYFNEIFPDRLTIKSGAKKEDLYELFITAKIMEEQLLGNK